MIRPETESVEYGRSLDSPKVQKTGNRGKGALRAAIVTGLVITGLALAGCGEDRDDLLGSGTAASLNRDIDRINELVAEGNCLEALKLAEEVRLEVEGLGEGTNTEVRGSLLDGVTKLAVAVQRECEPSGTGETAEPVEETDQPEEQAPVAPEPEDRDEGNRPGGGSGGGGSPGSGGVTPGESSPPEQSTPQPPAGGGTDG
jgi:hypothetical protein